MKRNWLTNNIVLKLMALVLAVMTWIYVNSITSKL